MTEQLPISSRLAEDPASDLRRLLAVASEIPDVRIDAARDRVWRRMTDEALAHQGHAPPRLAESQEFSAALIARAAAFEPPYARQAGLYRSLAKPSSHRMRFVFAGASMAFAALLLVALPKLMHHGAGPTSDPMASKTDPHSTQWTAVANPAETVAPKPVQPTIPESLAVQGMDLRIVRPDGSISGDRVALGDSMWPAGSAPARMKIKGIGEAELSGDGAQLTVAQMDAHGVRLNLAQGRVSIHADKRSPDAPLIVVAQGVEVRVVGTIFSVKVGVGGPSVGVREGLVRVTPPGQAPIELGAGHYWSATVASAEDRSWSDESTGRLAGDVPTPSLAQVAAALPQKAAVEDAASEPGHVRHHTQKWEARHQAKLDAQERAALLASMKTAPLFGTPGFKMTDTDRTVMPAPNIAGTAVQAAVAVPVDAVKPRTSGVAGPVFDLDIEAVKYDGRSPSELEVAETRNRRRGTAGLHDLAVVYRALADNPSANPGQKRAANRSLAELLDNEMGAVQMAVGVWRELAPRFDAEDRSTARLAVLADLMEMGKNDEALGAAGDCLRDCSGDQKTFGSVLQVRLLALQGRTDEVKDPQKRPQDLVSAFRKTAFFFAQRADKFVASGQRERAKVAAELSLALDPNSPQAPSLRAIH